MFVGLDFSGRVGLNEVTVVGSFDLRRREVVELAVEAFLVGPADQYARRDLEVIKATPGATVAGERGGVAV